MDNKLKKALWDVESDLARRESAIGMFRIVHRLITSWRGVLVSVDPTVKHLTLLYRHRKVESLAVVLQHNICAARGDALQVELELQFPGIILTFCQDSTAGLYADLSKSAVDLNQRVSPEMRRFIASLHLEKHGRRVPIRKPAPGLKAVWKFERGQFHQAIARTLQCFAALRDVIEG